MTFERLIQVLRNAQTPEDIDKYRKEIVELIPSVSIMFDYDQHNRYHQYDLWMHTLMTVCYLPDDLDDMVYPAALLHDIGKVEACCRGKKENDSQHHFYGHPKISHRITETEILPYLEAHGTVLSEQQKHRLLYLILHHDDDLPQSDRKIIAMHDRLGHELFHDLMELEIADAKAHVILPKVLHRIVLCGKWAGYEESR